MITEEQVLVQLRRIIDPDFQKDIVSLGFVKDLKIEGSKVSVTIALTTPACPVKEQFETEARQAISELDGVREVQIKMTSQSRRQQTPFPGTGSAGSALDQVGSVIAISSCKGGVGKSTIAAHTAMELTRRGYKVGLLDADIYGPSLPTLFQLPCVPLRADAGNKVQPVMKNGLKLMSFGFLLGDQAAVLRGPIVTRYIQQLLLQTDWGELDYLFIDMPPGTGDIHITITQTIRLNGAVIVTTPHTLSLIDVARGILMFEKVSVPILGVINNMSYFTPPGSSEKHYVFGENGSRDLSERFGVAVLGEIPILTELGQVADRTEANLAIRNMVDMTVRAIGKAKLSQKDIPNIYADEEKISLKWTDGKEQVVRNFTLRLNSQDAYSVDELTGERKIKAEDIRKDIKAEKIIPLGNYALGIEWNDGHKSGIYSYKLIDKLAEESANA